MIAWSTMKFDDIKFVPVSTVDLQEGDLFFLKPTLQIKSTQACVKFGDSYKRLSDRKEFPIPKFAQVCPIK